MHLSYTQVVKRPALLHRLTGLNVKEFEVLQESFKAQYDQQVLQPRLSAPSRKRAAGGGQKGALPEVADKLLFILVYTRIYPLLFVQGLLFGIAESKACTWVGVLLPVLDAAMEEIHVRPKRAKGRSLEQIKAANVSFDYDRRYSKADWTGPRFVESIVATLMPASGRPSR